MANNLQEFSSSLSYTSPSYVSNGSSSNKYTSPNLSCGSVGNGSAAEPLGNLDFISLKRLSCNLERLLLSDDSFDCTDAEIEVEGSTVGVHRCILAVRSPFFYELFTRRKNGSTEGVVEEKPRYLMGDLVPFGHIGLEAFKDFLWYIYTGKPKAPDPAVATCVDKDCAHDACRPAIALAVELMYASYIFQISELVSLLQRRLLNFVEKAFTEDVIPILLVASHSKQAQLTEHCMNRIAFSNLNDVTLHKELPSDLAEKIGSIRSGSQCEQPIDPPQDTIRDKGIKRIYRALDSDDVELVKMLLTESDITLDDADALHYAASYCDSKVVAEVLELGEANVNFKNRRGYTPLHMAAMRRDPAVIIALLRKGAYALAIADDGRTAVGICRRLTRMKDYTTRTEQGEESNRDRICIDILEREMRRIPMTAEETMTPPSSLDDLQLQLPYYESRVALANLFFPAEAKVAMEIAETASKYPPDGSKCSSGLLKKEVDLNETPAMREKRLRLKMDMLKKTVQLGRWYFPHCSEVLDKIMDDEYISDFNPFEQGAPVVKDLKRRRYNEIQQDVEKAFSKDKADLSVISSSSSSSSLFKGDKRLYRSLRK